MQAPDAKGVPVMPGADGQAPNAAAPQTAAPATAPAAATPFRAKPEAVPGEQEPTDPPEGELDGDDLESSMSLAAIEAELKPKMLETFDNVADSYKRLRRLQDQDRPSDAERLGDLSSADVLRLHLAHAGHPHVEEELRGRGAILSRSRPTTDQHGRFVTPSG